MTKASLMQIFDMRGLKDQTTFLPESNNSIQQGGLTFYVMKDETRLEGPWHDSTHRPAKKVKYEAKDLQCMRTPLPFQSDIMAMLRNDPDDRSIIWVADLKGNHGKSKLMKWLRFDQSLNCIRVPMGSAVQIKSSVIEKKGPHRVYMVDLPLPKARTSAFRRFILLLKEIENGWVETAMYGKTAELMMEPPHVIIFSNAYPRVSMLSTDRWKVYDITTEYGTQRD